MAGKYRYGIFISMNLDNTKYIDDERFQLTTDRFYLIIEEIKINEFPMYVINKETDNHSIYSIGSTNKMKYLQNSQITSLKQAKKLLSIIKDSFTPLNESGVIIGIMLAQINEKPSKYIKNVWPLDLMLTQIYFEFVLTLRLTTQIDLNFDLEILRLDVNTNTVDIL